MLKFSQSVFNDNYYLASYDKYNFDINEFTLQLNDNTKILLTIKNIESVEKAKEIANSILKDLLELNTKIEEMRLAGENSIKYKYGAE